jgi:hypothetical protein
MRSIARRISFLTDEIALHDTAMKQLIDEAAPQLVAEPGIGHVTAAMFYIAWSQAEHPIIPDCAVPPAAAIETK